MKEKHKYILLRGGCLWGLPVAGLTLLSEHFLFKRELRLFTVTSAVILFFVSGLWIGAFWWEHKQGKSAVRNGQDVKPAGENRTGKRNNIKTVMKYLAIPLAGVLFALAAVVVGWTPGTAAGTILLKILLIALTGAFITAYAGISRKWFVKVPARMDVTSWLRYTLLWGLLYSGGGLLMMTPSVTFFVLLILLPGVTDAAVITRDIMRDMPSLLFWLPAAGFLAGNIGFFLYGSTAHGARLGNPSAQPGGPAGGDTRVVSDHSAGSDRLD